MFLGVVACLLFFNVLSSQSLTARIKPNRTSFVFESGIKPNITCESDCGYYNWKCMYKWIAEKNGKLQTYIDKNNSRIDTPLKENVTLLCYVTHGYNNNIKVYSKRINLFIKERLLSTATPINDSKNDNDERTNITRESEYPPGDVTITPGDDTFYKKRYGKTLHNITCKADCVPECTYTWYREGYSYRYTTGNSLFATRYYYYSDSSRFRCCASNAIKPCNNYSRWITVKVKDGPDNVTIIPSLPAIENSSFTLTCSASCYHGCQSYSWYHDGRSMNQRTKVLEFHRLSKEDSGRYRCQVTNYFGRKSGYYTLNVQYKPMITSSKNETTITAPDLLDLTFSVDSSPSSNVTKTLTFLPNVTGQLSFNVSIESCLDRGDYRIEAVNDVGFGSPIVVRHSNVAHKEFRVGDLLHLTVTFMANPTAEVQWSFVPWNQNTSLEVQTKQIQTHKESTKLVLILSDTNKFGKYILELKNELGKISKEFNIQGPIVAATKTDPGTTISSRDSDSDGDRSMSPTSWKGKTNALRETEMNTFLLQQDKLHEEVQKLRLEGDVLRLKRNYYVIKLQVLMKEHPDIIDEVFGED